MDEVICYWIPIQTLQFRTALPTRQDGVEKRVKFSSLNIGKIVSFILQSSIAGKCKERINKLETFCKLTGP